MKFWNYKFIIITLWTLVNSPFLLIELPSESNVCFLICSFKFSFGSLSGQTCLEYLVSIGHDLHFIIADKFATLNNFSEQIHGISVYDCSILFLLLPSTSNGKISFLYKNSNGLDLVYMFSLVRSNRFLLSMHHSKFRSFLIIIFCRINFLTS